MLRLEPMGMDGVLPAVVVGFDVTDDAENRAEAVKDPADGVVLIDQQAGGLCMEYPVVVGTILPLEANIDRGSGDGVRVIRGLLAMEEDPDIARIEKEFPILRSLVLTQGNPYARGDLDRLHTFVGGGFRLPPFEGGIEAFVRCVPADPLTCVRDWRAFSCKPRDADGGLSVIDHSFLRTSRDQLIIDDQRRFDDALCESLRATAARIGATGVPRLFLLWSNSD